MDKGKLTSILLVLTLMVVMPMMIAASPMGNIPQRDEDYTDFVPLRLTAYAHGADVEWDGENRLVIITNANGDTITVSVESVGGFIVDGVSFVPYDYAINLFGAESRENASSQTESEADELIAAILRAIDTTRSFVYEHSEVLEITSFDGYVFKSRLTTPAGDDAIPAIVIDTGTSGPHTYLSMRYAQGIGFWYYHDFFAREYVNNGIAFMSSNTRGVSHGTEPPMFVEIDEIQYRTYTPSNVVEDVYHMIRAVRENPRLADAQIFLFGGSEGATVAALFAETYPGMADALFMLGTPIMDMTHTLRWQSSGESVMLFLGSIFGIDEYMRISAEMAAAAPWEAVMGAAFEEMDLDGDGFFTAEDLIGMWQRGGGSPHLWDYTVILDAVERGDDEWMRDVYSPQLTLTTNWLADHISLRSAMEIIPELDIPIYIFHGELDANVHVAYVLELQELLEEMGRTNVKVNIFPGHSHGLNYGPMALIGDVSYGIEAIINAVLARAQY